MEIYLDNSATTRVCPEAVKAAVESMEENYGNPSSVHYAGIRAKTTLEDARKNIAGALNVQPGEIYFSPSGTLANNTAVFGAVEANGRNGKRIVTTRLEHPSVAKCMDALEERGFEVIRLRPGADAAFSEKELFEAVDGNTILVSAMLVNNEVGAINPVECIKTAVKRASAPALIHVDAIQAFGKMPVNPARTGIDLLSLSGHKIHAPKGAGALYIRKGVKIKSRVSGGGQENDMFSGTEPLPAIAGFGAAVKAMPDLKKLYENTKKLRDLILSALKSVPDARINSPENALPNIINLSVLGIPSQALINFLAAKGIYVSGGSACARGRRSAALTALGLPNEAIDSAIRVSLSRYTTALEAEKLVEALKEARKKIRTKRKQRA